MSLLNFTRKTFLEREELDRFQEFLQDSAVSNAILGNTIQFGIIQDEFDSPDLNFLATLGTNTGTIQFEKERSQAVDIDFNLIRLPATDNIAVTNDSNWYWVRISHEYRRYEAGTVILDSSGQLTGAGTLFTEVLRGQATDVPVSVRFVKSDGSTPTNNGTYEVVNTINDTNALLTSTTTFVNESDLRMIVIGATPIGEIVSTEQLEGLYLYDSCNIELIQEVTLDTPPDLPVGGEDKYFYVARVTNVANVITIEDKRTSDIYWNFNIAGLGDTLRRSNNLSDLLDTTGARANLDVDSSARVDEKISNVETSLQADIDLKLSKSSNLSDVSSTSSARTNLNVYSKTEIDNNRGVLAYDAYIEGTTADTSNITRTEHVNDGLISTVNLLQTQYEYVFSSSITNFERNFSLFMTARGGSTTQIGSYQIFTGSATTLRINMRNSAGTLESFRHWIRIYRW